MINRRKTVACLTYETSCSCFLGDFSNNEIKLIEISNPVKAAIVKVCCLPAPRSNINHALLVTIIFAEDRPMHALSSFLRWTRRTGFHVP